MTVSAPVGNEPTNIEKLHGLRWSAAETAANTVFVQFTYFGSVFILFLNELQLKNSQIGLLLSFFPFFGLVAIFISPWVARFGYKRTFVIFWTIRKFITALLLLVPFVLDQFGSSVTLIFVGLIVVGFGLCRAIAEVGYYPWNQEFVPTTLRGRYTAIANLFSNVVGIISIVVASLVIENLTGLNRFMLLFGVGVIFGLLGAWFMTRVPGGAPVERDSTQAPAHRDMFITFGDRNFWLFIICLGLVTLGTAPMFSFLPLFMKQVVGLSEGNVVFLQNGTLIGALLATFIVGWSTDRYGSKPVMRTGLSLMVLLPIIWLLIPINSDLSFPIALAASLIQGIATLMWAIGFGKLLFVNVVPAEHKAPYMAVYYATIGLIGGTSQLLGGFVLDLAANLSGTLGFYTYNQFTPTFVLGLTLLLGSMVVLHFVRSDTSVGSWEFVGLFFRGNPMMAFESMIRYYRAKDERTAVAMTEKLGQSHSPLTVDELLEALDDPRFNVRFEAIISIARTNPDPRFVEALVRKLHGSELALSSVAGWALGRIGDQHAVEALRRGLSSRYRSVQAQSARSLGTLGDTSMSNLLIDRLSTETDRGLQIAFAAALGSLVARDAIEPMLNLLDVVETERERSEVSLSLARIIDAEPQFIQLQRQLQTDIGTAIAQSLMSVKPKLEGIGDVVDRCVDLWSHEDLEAGAIALIDVLQALPEDASDPARVAIMRHCAGQLKIHLFRRLEYIILILIVLEGIEASPE